MPRKTPAPGSAADLRIKCESKGLETKGKKKKNELAELLKNYECRELASSSKAPPEDESLCDAFFVSRISIAAEETMKTTGNEVLQQALAVEELYVNYDGGDGDVAICNKDAFSFVELLHNVHILEQKVNFLELENEEQKKKISALQDKAKGLANSLEAYKDIRKRFISTFKHNGQETETGYDRMIIKIGNMWAHGGDALVDVQLYEGNGKREDPFDFQQSYGFLPETVLRFSR